jgi:hypothetical protein
VNAIIAAATGYAEADLRVFLHSVERSCGETKVFLLVYKRDRETIASLRSRYEYLELVPITKKIIQRVRKLFPPISPIVGHLVRHLSMRDYSSVKPLSEALGRYPLHIAIERYFISLEIVRAYSDSFSNVLLTDSRDVVIQSDPFSSINERLISGVEEGNIGGDPYNSGWIKRLYGKHVLTRMSNRRIVCSGVTLGPRKEVENYLRKMCSEIWRHLPQISCELGFDQGIHNRLIFSGDIRLDLADNRDGLIATLGMEKPVNILKDPANGLLKVHGHHPAIVHQYDRYPDLAEFFRQSPHLR